MNTKEDGLELSLEQFRELPIKEQNTILYREVVEIKQKFTDYSFHRKIQYVWLSVLSVMLGLSKYLGLSL